LDNRIDATPNLKDFNALLLKVTFLNEQLNIAIQELMVLKTRNELKISPQELYAKRTEHLEKQSLNPNIQIYYGKLRPDLQGFLVQDLKTEPSRDSIFKIEVQTQEPHQAFLSITDRSEFHHISLNHAPQMLDVACSYELAPYNDTRIIVLDKGLLQLHEGKWLIIKKVQIAFE
jgi:hypothetical protein